MSVNPLIAGIRIPGETVRLPSMGLFYDNGELDESVLNGEVHVHPMSAIDEIELRNIDKIINGDAISEVFARCIPQIKKPSELYSKDVDALLLVLRRVTYGPTIPVTYTHNCDEAKQHKYDVNLSEIIRATKSIDPTTIDTMFKIVMDSGQIVHLHPIKHKDVVQMMQESRNFDTAPFHEIQRKLVEATIHVIHSVDGITDRDQIKEWATMIPVSWFKKISEAIDANNDWGPITSYTVECKDCGELIEIEVPLNPLTFFLDY